MKKDKDFDAVSFQRKTREKLSREYLKNHKAFVNKLKQNLEKQREKAA